MSDQREGDRVDADVEQLIAFVDAQADELRPADPSRRVDRPDFKHLLRRDLVRILSDRTTP
jgi:hypothetical protein